MSDVSTSDAALSQRIAALEAWVADEQARRAAVVPAAAPITIGPMSNVPAPGSPIRSDWPQQLSTLWNRGRDIYNSVTLPAVLTVKAWDVNSIPFVIAGTFSGTTDAGGIMGVPYGFTVTGGVRSAVAINGDYTIPLGWAARWSVQATQALFVCYNGNNTPRVSLGTRLDVVITGWQAS